MFIYLLGQKIRLEVVVILCVVLGGFIALNTMCACNREGYGLMSSTDVIGTDMAYSIGDGVKSSWVKRPQGERTTNNLESMPGSPNASDLLIFDKTKFSPDCCPSIYSNSMGCVCASAEQMKFLNERGGNRTLYSEY